MRAESYRLQLPRDIANRRGWDYDSPNPYEANVKKWDYYSEKEIAIV